MSSLSLSFDRCPVFRRLKEEAEKRKRPSWNELKGRKSDGESPGDAKHSATPRDQPEPGLINPAYEESEDGRSHLHLYNNHLKSVFCTNSISGMTTS